MIATRAIDNLEDVIDSRDVIEQIEELEAEETLTHAERYQLDALKALAEEGRDNAGEWEEGTALVRDDYWLSYAEEFFNDVYFETLRAAEDLSSYVKIDYDMFARDLQMDYSPIEFDGVTYWVRSY